MSLSKWTAPLSDVFVGIFRPEGASTYQPRAERRGVSRGASPWEVTSYERQALKGRDIPTLVSPLQGLAFY